MMSLFFGRPMAHYVRVVSLALCWIGLSQACAPHVPKPPLHAVASLDVQRYMGTWHEIAALPNPFQKDCYQTQAIYGQTDQGEITVHNLCRKGSLDGPLSEVQGRAWRPKGQGEAELKVQFFWPFSGDYWVLALDPDYQWAVVGQPKRKYLWILARKTHMDETLYARLKQQLPAWGYDPERLRRTPHVPR
jgi:apolipoprotein D and lipocalin family protein